MPDNITAPGVGTALATDEIAGVHYPRTKIAVGADGSAGDVHDGNGLPIKAATGAVFAGNGDPASDVFLVAPDDDLDLPSPIRVLDVLAAGDVSFVTAAGQTRSFTAIPVGYSFRCRIARVRETGTTSAKLIGHV